MMEHKNFQSTADPIGSVKALCRALDITTVDLYLANRLSPTERYIPKAVPKSDGTVRKVYNPVPRIRVIQRRINKRLFNPPGGKKGVIAWPYYIFGSIPDVSRDYVSCAKVHCGAKSILKVDISEFFDNIHIDLVKDIFSDLLRYDLDVSEVIANLCCRGDSLVQGGLTSSYIASLCLYDEEPWLVSQLERKGLSYTRLVDDITISSKKANYDFSYAKDLVIQMLHRKGLPVNYSKTKAYYLSSEPLLVHGLRVAYKTPRLPSKEISRIRAAVKNIEKLASETNYRTTHPYRKDFNRCMGRVNKLKRVGHNQHKKLVSRLNKVRPLPSKKDIEICKNLVARLENDYSKKSGSYWYWKRFNHVQDRLNILSRTFKVTTYDLRSRLRKIRPDI